MPRTTTSTRHRHHLQCRHIDELRCGGVVGHCVQAQVHDLQAGPVGPTEHHLMNVCTLAIRNRRGVVVQHLARRRQDAAGGIHTHHSDGTCTIIGNIETGVGDVHSSMSGGRASRCHSVDELQTAILLHGEGRHGPRAWVIWVRVVPHFTHREELIAFRVEGEPRGIKLRGALANVLHSTIRGNMNSYNFTGVAANVQGGGKSTRHSS
mmetsp:Transcript_2081/g.3737  ORF Transcript_2081/g.3737 Transcript_2081/m.3737 type:complete len:208 (+) Transcript_2081:1215-1838(+)